MANPSLQIGNSNWAIKEDNLLGYSTAGTRFVPQPITMTRASAGTRVNSSGLVETVELLGSEEVTDGNFPLPNTNWILGGSGSNTPTIGTNDVAINSVDGNSFIQQSGILTSGKYYKITYDVISASATSNVLKLASSFGLGSIPTSVGTQVVYGTASTSTFYIERYTNGVNATITNISVKESTKNNLARVDYDGTASSLLVEPERTNLLTYSEDFSNASWVTVSGSVTKSYNTTTSPSGLEDADSILATSAGSIVWATYQPLTADYTGTLYLKRKTGSGDIQFTASGTFSTVDLSSGDWVRVEHTYSATAGTKAIGIKIVDSGDEVYIWGGQLEVGSYATSYIPTDGGTVTRVRDQYSKTGISNLIGQTKGTMFIDLNFINISNVQVLFSLHDGAANKRLEIWASSAVVNGFVGGSVNIPIGATTITNGRHKIALAYDQSGNQAFYVDGVQIGTSGTAYTISALTTFSFNYFNNTTYFLNGSVNHTEIYKERLTNEELATLTTI